MLEKIFEVIQIEWIIIYIIAINLLGLFIMFYDKRKAEKGQWRIKEGTIMLVTLLGGGIGTISGMYIFRHKTKKLKFTVGLPTILITEVVLIIYFFAKQYGTMLL